MSITSVSKYKNEQNKITAEFQLYELETFQLLDGKLPVTKLKYKPIDNHLNIHKLSGC
jgi:hypothetical protein